MRYSRVSSDVVKNTAIAESFRNAADAVLAGEQFSKALRDTGDFDSLLINMVEIGEKTGTLDNAILRVSDTYDREIPETMKKVFTVVEPLTACPARRPCPADIGVLLSGPL